MKTIEQLIADGTRYKHYDPEGSLLGGFLAEIGAKLSEYQAQRKVLPTNRVAVVSRIGLMIEHFECYETSLDLKNAIKAEIKSMPTGWHWLGFLNLRRGCSKLNRKLRAVLDAKKYADAELVRYDIRVRNTLIANAIENPTGLGSIERDRFEALIKARDSKIQDLELLSTRQNAEIEGLKSRLSMLERLLQSNRSSVFYQEPSPPTPAPESQPIRGGRRVRMW